MRRVQSPGEPPAVLTDRLDDFDRFASVHALGRLRIEQLSAGRFEGSYLSVLGGRLRATVVDFNQVLLVRGQSSPGRVAAYPVAPENADGVWHGRRLDPGRLVVHGPDGTTDHRSSRRCRLMELSATADEFVRCTRVLLGADVGAGPRAWTAASPPPDAVAAVVRSTRLMLALAADPAILTTAEGRLIEEECIRRLVDAIHPAIGRDAPDLPLGARSALARRAEDFIRSRLDEPAGSIELCAELGVSERTLRRACLERWGMGPIEYSRSLRLNAVRADLKGLPGPVADIARRWGFRHLGNFAGDYRKAFGERPSQTARRSS